MRTINSQAQVVSLQLNFVLKSDVETTASKFVNNKL